MVALLPTPSLQMCTNVRMLWTSVLGEVKKFSERKIPQVDLEAFLAASKEVCALEPLTDDSTYTDEQQQDISKLCKMLVPFSEEALIFEDAPENGAKFKEGLDSVTKWFESFQPDFEKFGEVLADAVCNSTNAVEESAGLEAHADAFPPSPIKVPNSFDSVFQLQ